MRYSAVHERLSGLGSAKWAVHRLAREMKAQGTAIIELTIGEPDSPTPPEMIETARAAMRPGRLGYSDGRGEPGLRRALAERYSTRRGREIDPDQIICLPGTQTCLYAIFRTLVENGDEVLLGDPMYATYEGLIRQTGAVPVPVALRPEHGFRLQVADLEAAITERTRVIFLNTPHNPTGAVLTRQDIAAIGALAQKHDLWLVSDEVYEDLVFPGVTFTSPLELPELAERSVSAASISKSHAAPGFRSGWVVGPKEFTERLLPLSEVMLFGSQPFLADMTELAVSKPSPIAAGMVERFARRAGLVADMLDGKGGLRVHRPEAGMFALVDVRATGLSGQDFALALLRERHVAVMPGESFGAGLSGWLRLSLTQPDEDIAEACRQILDFAGP
ncbi:pyridoxal phosphate-dependent aminotransferase [Xinfangfangia sp. D13-10-4-6]|uniref:pyridoxal phosphate-dependent aminotransferase n=1 Tax=Pseudogemmobacter hezensis TaxID=2737662 RepID=UPI001554C800|nr:pyridoxal phosphate-dependent aminotransferase [Pseudogemmobacter hezensis]NPD16425.1 pyridoxal phosphate-dependent aminotransferase [Pseudogemmobacter hezensis]